MKYANIDKNNQLLGWYDIEIHTSIPTPNIEVTDEQWQIAINSGHNKVNADGTTELFDFRTKDEVANEALQTKLQEATQYLDSTDWYVTRLTETSKAIPEDVLAKRAEARLTLNS